MERKPPVLIIEDDKNLNLINRRALEAEGYDVKSVLTLAEARLMLKDFAPEVILLDVKLPDGTGFELCREIREQTAAFIIFLTSVSGPDAEMEGLRAGGNDYLRKPYSIDLLRERVKNAVGHQQKPLKAIERGALTLDVMNGQAFIDGADLLLSQKEFALLRLLVQNEGKIVRVESIYEKVWGGPMLAGDKNAVQMSVSRLRKKIEPAGFDIYVTRGKGYTFE